MKKRFLYLCVVLLVFAIDAFSQNADLNLGFEEVENNWPAGWTVYHAQSDYIVSVDSIYTHGGKYSVSIESKDRITDFQTIEFALPNNYKGNKITLSGYIKTSHVGEGFAGLWFMMDPDSTYDNIETCGVKIFGTTDWKKYEVTLDLDPLNVQKIVIGGILSGKGKIWVDDLAVSIDGNCVTSLPRARPSLLASPNDTMFNAGSKIDFPCLEKYQIENLELVGRLWGFLKYHHPVITKGAYNWDYELFRILPAYLKVKKEEERDALLCNWIARYGEIPSDTPTADRVPQNRILSEPDLKWITEGKISPKLKEMLITIYRHRSQGAQFYVKMAPYFGNPVFNEKMYETMPEADAGFQLLSLFRLWNMVYYFYPYQHLTDRSWDSLLGQYIPRFIEVGNRLDYEKITALFIGELSDSHAYPLGFWYAMDRLRGERQAPVKLRFVEDQLVVDAYYAISSELKKGDVILRIEGKPVQMLVDSMLPYYSASNLVTKMRDITNDILRTNQDSILIEYKEAGNCRMAKLPVIARQRWMEYRFGADTTACFRLLNDSVGYVNLSSIKKENIEVVKSQIARTKGVVIDIRNYPPGFLMNKWCPYFVKGPIPYLRYSQINIDNPGEADYFLNPEIINPSDEYYPGKVIILVNEETQSRAECMAMAFQARENTVTVGSQTAGSLGNPSLLILPGILGTQFTGNRVHYPDGGETERVGVKVDRLVKPTLAGFRAGRDELLESALKIMEAR